MSRAPRKRTFAARLRSAAVPLLVTVVFSLLLDRNEAMERAALDLQARLRSARPSPEVVAVHIEDADYQTLFGARSPLDPEVVQWLIAALAKGRPAVIGVDLDTRDPLYARVPDRVNGVPIVWARDVLCRGVRGSSSRAATELP